MAAEMDVWALTEWNKPMEKIKQPIPTPTGSEVLIRVTHAGLCHSDLHFAEGFHDMGGGQRIYLKDRGAKLPIALGHEILGDVVSTGPDATGLEEGSRQIVYPWLGCGNCTRCRQNQDNLCGEQKGLGYVAHGGFAEYVMVPHPKYLFAAGDLDPSVACTYGCSGLTTFNAVSKVMPLPPDEPVLLIGAGGLGLAAISVLKSYGHKNIISTDLNDERLAVAAKAGAKTVNTSGTDASKKILEATGGPVIAVIDFVNSSGTAAMINNELIARGAKWVQVGVMGGSIEMSLVANTFRALSIDSVIVGDLQQMRAVTDLAKNGKLSPVPVQEMPWDGVNGAMDLLSQGKATGRIVLVK